MDVVKKTVEGLRGQVDIESEQGQGSVFTFRLPLTLAIIDAMDTLAARKYVLNFMVMVPSLWWRFFDYFLLVSDGAPRWPTKVL